MFVLGVWKSCHGGWHAHQQKQQLPDLPSGCAPSLQVCRISAYSHPQVALSHSVCVAKRRWGVCPVFDYFRMGTGCRLWGQGSSGKKIHCAFSFLGYWMINLCLAHLSVSPGVPLERRGRRSCWPACQGNCVTQSPTTTPGRRWPVAVDLQ